MVQPARQHDCSRPGCKVKADCTPVLVVPSHPMSKNSQYEGVRSILWLPLCNPHFSAATVREFMNGEVIAGVKASIENDFRENAAIPNWNKAVIQKLGKNSKEFQGYERIATNVLKGAPADVAVAAELGKPN